MSKRTVNGTRRDEPAGVRGSDSFPIVV